MDNEEQININQMRKWIYYFLGHNYYYGLKLDESFISKNLSILRSVKENLNNEDFLYMVDYLLNINSEKNLDLQNEYKRLFIGPEKVLVPPWSSVYLNPEGIIFDENTLNVREFYASWNVKIRDFKLEPEDHIGIQMEFLYTLVEKSLNSESNEEYMELLAAQKEFIEDFILNWLDKFIGHLIKTTNSEYYKSLARFTEDYIKMDLELVDDLILG